ncbi:NADPH-dependent FMN reductase [Agrobacterium sp. 22-226-1]
MKLLGISGSLRKESLNTRLLKGAGTCPLVSAFRLADLRLPLFDEDIETSGTIAPAVECLLADIAWSDAVLFATPEYNKNTSGVLKNALDWISRHDSKPLRGKPVAICSVAAGRSGGIQAQYSLRHCLTPFSPVVLQGPEIAITFTDTVDGAATALGTERTRERLTRLVTALSLALHDHRIKLEA